MLGSQSGVAEASPASSGSVKFHWLSANPGKRRTEIIYFFWYLLTAVSQVLTMQHLSYDKPNDLLLVSQATVAGLGTLLLPLLFRAHEDRGLPLRELYGFRMGVFLFIWAVMGGFIGTDPWYEVLHGHFAFNTTLNPNDVPLFMLPVTIATFGFYSVILGTLYRIITQLLGRTHTALSRDTFARHALLCLILAPLMPLLETFAFTSSNYCFDNGTGMWGLNILIYGAWHFAALLFYTRWDAVPGERVGLETTVVAGFATVGLLMTLMAITETFIAPHFIHVQHGLVQINDWSPNNCLGPKP
jgi:hypothetical protein